MKTTKICNSADEALAMANAEIDTLETRLAEATALLGRAKDVLTQAQERLEIGAEVNRAGENVPRVTATSCFIRVVLADLERFGKGEK